MKFSRLSSKISHKLSTYKKRSSKKESSETCLPGIQEEQKESAESSGSITPTQSMTCKKEETSEAQSGAAMSPQGELADNVADTPANDNKPAASTEIVSKCPISAPLRRTHYLCFTKHATFQNCSNTHHSLPCMTCKREDFPQLWRCSFCFLRICGDCKDTLCRSKDRPLQKLLEALGIDAECP
ncbi:hypothetical protein PRK78_003961 [Emydomyces testavorans]|uniref:Uncharacterized protein n=1 Tax=Emydomyces testavorans TaxID=2070801 RepID=A0AAF0DHU7_9EURO|nr:hypothetical protein PRK78_003961 [Emydomyces testavorans]